MAGKINNCFLINAPAGSGKTTEISSMVKRCIFDNPRDNILCITYTNRAAEEMSKNISSPNAFIGTIHSFLHFFMKPYFAHQDVLKLYFDIYGEQIVERIANIDQKDNISESNNRYIEKFGKLDYDTIRKNIKTLSYNESPFSSFYYGGLSHDDLISFSKAVFDHYPIIGKRISSKYQYIFIDEYQDTMSDVLKIFFESVIDTKSKLYLFGDRMQQIYKNYDGSFEGQFELFDTTKALTTNYRSTKDIVAILNRIYNDSSFVQSSSVEMRNATSDYPPRIIVSHDIQADIEELRRTNSDTLVLYLFNKERFAAIGAYDLYGAYDGMERYSFGKVYSAVDVLTESYVDNPDALLKLLYCMVELASFFNTKQYGKIIQVLRNNKSIFNRESWHIQTHNDKEKVFTSLRSIFSIFDDKSKTISDLIDALTEAHLLNETYLNGIIDDEDYKRAYSVPLIELTHIYEYLNSPKVSTQHGVKGESHDSVVFVAEDSTRNPSVAMYRFFEMWGEMSVSSNSLNQFYYDFTSELSEIQCALGMKASKLIKDTYELHEKVIQKRIEAINNRFKDNPYFRFIYSAEYSRYQSKPGVTKAKNCLNDNSLYSILSAYKLFYVGCSRARRNLTILLDRSKIKGDFELQQKRFEEIGFEVIKN